MRIFPKACAILVVLLAVPARAQEPRIEPSRGYARAGTVELGGFAHFMVAKDYSALGLYPTFGWFAWDNIELSAIVGVSPTM